MSIEEKLDLDGGRLLPLVEDFYTIQGEGRYTGAAAYFIRLAGCDVGCAWCDAQYTWNLKKYALTPIEEVVGRVKASGTPLVVITGGEPTMYDLEPLTRALHEAGVGINIETSGGHTLRGAFDWICLSPKRKKAPLKENLPLADELKVVISDDSDFEWAEANATHTSKKCILYLQVEWSRSAQMMPKVVEYVKAHPEWRVSLQTHKYMNIP